jgi:hypothetical protein
VEKYILPHLGDICQTTLKKDSVYDVFLKNNGTPIGGMRAREAGEKMVENKPPFSLDHAFF